MNYQKIIYSFTKCFILYNQYKQNTADMSGESNIYHLNIGISGDIRITDKMARSMKPFAPERFPFGCHTDINPVALCAVDCCLIQTSILSAFTTPPEPV